MATVNKDFKIKSGLIVEGTSGTINGEDILTTSAASTQHIIDIVGGETLITSVESTQLEVISGELNVKANVFDAHGAAATAEQNANDYTDTAIGNLPAAYITSTTTEFSVTNGELSLDQLNGLTQVNPASGNQPDTGYGTIEYVDTDAGTEGLRIKSERGWVGNQFGGQLDIDAYRGLNLTSRNGDIVLNADGDTYLGSVGSGNDVATTGYVNGLASNYDPAGSASTAETNANNYTNTALESYTPSSSLDATVGGYGYIKSADLSGYATETYVNTAVDNLVDGAPGLLDTLNEIAAAINDDANYATTITTALSGKQATLTPGSNIDITNDVIAVTGLDSADISDFNTAALSATASAYDASGAASTVQGNLDDHASDTVTHGVTGNIVGTSDSQTLTNKTISGSSNTISNIDNSSLVNSSITVNGQSTALGSSVTLDTDDVSEGSLNLYYTDARAKAEAAALLTGATKTNITITADGSNNLTITAENGVADSDTDDLTEGTTNLYFTDERAIDAISNADIYPNAVILDNIAKQVATSQVVATASTVGAVTWAKADYRSAELLVKVAYGDHTEVAKVLLTLDVNDNIAITEYGIVGTNGSGMTIGAAIVAGTNVQLQVTTLNNNSTVTAVGTLLV